ncbi:outer membrane beta-barrel protein, partial [bacterium]|nr:outer membrane beta-barrel protein [bacterium]
PRQQNDWNGLLKWTWNIDPRHKINFNASRQLAVSQGFKLPGEGYARPMMDNLDNSLVFTNENILNQLYYRWVIGEKDFFELSLGRNFSRMHANLIGNDDYTTYPGYDNPTSPSALASGSSDRWHDHYSESWTLKSSYAWVASETNQFKTGFDLSFTEMQLIDLKTNLSLPPSGKLAFNEDIFKVHPVVGAAYFQDTVNYRGMVVNAGLRLDAWAPGREVEAVMDRNDDYLFVTPEMKEEFYDETVEFWLRSWKLRLSPRLGVSFPVTEKDKFFFNYGHFSQWPRYAYVYPQLTATTASEIQLLGNPNLDPKVTVEYEAGIQHEFPGLWSVGVTFFNRDIYDYAKSVRMNTVDIGADETPDPNDEGTETIEPVRYFNGDSARSLGIEMTVIKRTTGYLSGSASLELSSSTGTNSKADQGYLEAVYGDGSSAGTSLTGLQRSPLLWDKPWRVSINLDFSVFEDERPTLPLLGLRLPANWSLNMLFSAETGQRYTPLGLPEGGNVYDTPIQGDTYSGLGPYKSSLNVRFNKYWNLTRANRLTFYVEARNLLNHINYRRGNSWTGARDPGGDHNPPRDKPWGPPGEPSRGDTHHPTDSLEYAKARVNPSYVENPRMILMGVSFSW